MILRLIGKRLLLGVLTLLAAALISFLLVHAMKGSPGLIVKGIGATRHDIWLYDEGIGWHKPLWEQFLIWLGNLLHGDLGVSTSTQAPIMSVLPDRVALTATLAIGASLLTTIIGVLVGVTAAIRGGWIDRILNTGANTFFAVPGYWLAILLILIFAVLNPILPATGYVPPTDDLAGWAQSLVLPIVAIAIPAGAGLSRSTRAAMFDAFSQEYIRTLRSMGTPKWRLIYVHSLRYASVQIVAMIGMQFVILFGGTVMIEQLFVLPGLGDAAQGAIANHDVAMIQAVVLTTTLVVVITNFMTELVIMYLNPKVRTK